VRGRVGGPVDELPTRSATSAREKGSPARSGFFARRRVEPVRRDGSGRAARPPERAAKARTSRRDGAGRAGLLALAATVGHDRGVQVLHERGVHRVSVRCSSSGLTGPTLGPRAKARPNPHQTAAKRAPHGRPAAPLSKSVRDEVRRAHCHVRDVPDPGAAALVGALNSRWGLRTEGPSFGPAGPGACERRRSHLSWGRPLRLAAAAGPSLDGGLLP